MAAGTGWFVLNMREARWWYRGHGFEAGISGDGDFPQIGIGLTVLSPGEPMTMYHWETDQEAFLVLSGEALLVIEGEERALRQWDFVHVPPRHGTRSSAPETALPSSLPLAHANATRFAAPTGACRRETTGAHTPSTRLPSVTARASSRRRPTRRSHTLAFRRPSRCDTAAAGFLATNADGGRLVTHRARIPRPKRASLHSHSQTRKCDAGETGLCRKSIGDAYVKIAPGEPW